MTITKEQFESCEYFEKCELQSIETNNDMECRYFSEATRIGVDLKLSEDGTVCQLSAFTTPEWTNYPEPIREAVEVALWIWIFIYVYGDSMPQEEEKLKASIKLMTEEMRKLSTIITETNFVLTSLTIEKIYCGIIAREITK